MDSTPKGGKAQDTIPFHARLFHYQLEASEQHLLRTMLEFNSEGTHIWASLETMAMFSRMSAKQIKRLIRGWTNKRTGEHTRGLVERGILTELNPPNSKGKNAPAEFRINEAALTEDPSVMAYREEQARRRNTFTGVKLPKRPDQLTPRQRILPGTKRRVNATQKHLRWGDTVSPLNVSGGTPCPPLFPLSSRDTVSGRGDTVSPDSLIDSRRGESVEGFGFFPGVETVEKTEKPTTTELVPRELAEGLRGILPSLDDAAILQIFQACKTNADDCTVDDIMQFAQAKAPFLPGARNPAGFLIHAVPLCVTPDALIALRDRRQREERNTREAEEQRAREDARVSSELAEYERQRELEARAEAKLETLPEDERAALKESVAQELFAKTPQARTWPNLRDHVRRLMIWRIADTLKQPANIV